MKERLLDVIKWGLILVIAGIVSYVVHYKAMTTYLSNDTPNYCFRVSDRTIFRCNKLSGKL